MGFKKLLGIDNVSTAATTAPATTTTVETSPPVVTATQDTDTQADYAQRSSHKRGLLSTILSNRNRASGMSSSSGGNNTLG